MSKFFNVTIEYKRGSILRGDPVAEQAHEAREARDLREILGHALAGLSCDVIAIVPTNREMIALSDHLRDLISRTPATRPSAMPINSDTDGIGGSGPYAYPLVLPGIVRPAKDSDLQPFPTWEASAAGRTYTGYTTSNAARLMLADELRQLGIEVAWKEQSKRSTSTC